MYSASNGEKLCQLPDLDIHCATPREPLKRKYKEKQRQPCGTPVSPPQHNCNSTMVKSTHEVPLDVMTLSREMNSTPSSSPIGSRRPRKGGRGKKNPQELLSDAQKKANHVASEKKRRVNIRIGFDQLIDIVPTLSHCHKSESLVLQKSYDYIQQLLDDKTDLKDRIRELQIVLGDVPDEDSSDEVDEYVI